MPDIRLHALPTNQTYRLVFIFFLGESIYARLGVAAMFRALSLWADRKLGVPGGKGLLVVVLAVAVGLQLAVTFAQIFCPPCMQTIFAILRRIETLL